LCAWRRVRGTRQQGLPVVGEGELAAVAAVGWRLDAPAPAAAADAVDSA